MNLQTCVQALQTQLKKSTFSEEQSQNFGYLYLLIFQIFQGKWTHHQCSSEENEDPKNKDLRSRTPKHENKDPKT